MPELHSALRRFSFLTSQTISAINTATSFPLPGGTR